MKKITLVTALLLLCSALSYGWGFFGHKLVHQLAIYNLPKELQGYYFKHHDYIVSKATRSDERCNNDPTEAPRHYIDIDEYGPDAVHMMPEAWAAANAFKQQNVDSILYYSADLGHYVADAHVPLHTTRNYAFISRRLYVQEQV